MSGYPLKTPYDADIKRRKYLEELALRARLDDENLQANKLYKRTGAISTLPDTRTSTEKLNDIYRLRIDIRSKLGQLMSGDDAQKVVNRLDTQELQFLAGRIDKYIAELKPKYLLGMPYQVFMNFLKDAIRNFNAYGEVETSRAVLEQMMANTAETQFAIENLAREIQFQGKKELIFDMDNIRKTIELIGRGQQLLDGSVINPALENDVMRTIEAVSKAVPTKRELIGYQQDFDKAVRMGDIKQQELIADEVRIVLGKVKTLENDITNLEQVIRETTEELPTLSIGKTSQEKLLTTYIEPYDPNIAYSYNEIVIVFDKLFEIIRQDPQKEQIWRNIIDDIENNYGLILKSVRSGKGLAKKLYDAWTSNLPRGERTSMRDDAVNWIIETYQKEFNDIFTLETRQIISGEFGNLFDMNSGPIAPPTTQQGIQITTQPVAQPPPTQQPVAQPPPTQQPVGQPKSTGDIIEDEVKPYLETKGLTEANYNLIKKQILDRYNVFIDDEFKRYITQKGTLKQSYMDWFNYWATELLNGNIKEKSFTDFMDSQAKKSKKSGSGMKRMKGGSVRIDINAGMRDDTNIPKYVPFGKYIINRSKLNDGVVMIKRPNGSFMGDLQSRRVSNNLRNVFEKVVGGNIPTYQDFAKLDEDEKQYLHYVSKKANLLDKLQVPTPNKDEEERMINRYEILRGQLVAGNDNKQMITEFKKLLLDMSDRKLLPRRQVSDILIDIEKMYG